MTYVKFSENLALKLDEYNLLNHSFYKLWSAGKLDKEILGEYAKQYYHHVKNFPCYISAAHSNCDEEARHMLVDGDNMKARKVLVDNLKDEEGEEDHPGLWLRFAKSLGVSVDEVEKAELFDETKSLVKTFFDLSKSSYIEGLATLFAYERQVPEVAKSKIDGLKKFYGLDSEDALKFFEVHIGADEWHSQECADLIDQVKSEYQAVIEEAALKGARALYKFLDGMIECMKKDDRYLKILDEAVCVNIN